MNLKRRRDRMSDIRKGENKFYKGEDENAPEAELVYSSDEKEIVIEHTLVSEQLRGQGIGEKLVDKAVQYARENNLKLDSQCPFAKQILENDDKYEDILQ
ncbi:GNAT family N-acetyltransferase [Rossellomorea vietnamensis]|uniref:GNAT family N-acetyltransferase n=1 Tax=Rossellomorea vietnamensis TaxID=218284 RepID=UPI003CEC9F07